MKPDDRRLVTFFSWGFTDSFVVAETALREGRSLLFRDEDLSGLDYRQLGRGKGLVRRLDILGQSEGAGFGTVLRLTEPRPGRKGAQLCERLGVRLGRLPGQPKG